MNAALSGVMIGAIITLVIMVSLMQWARRATRLETADHNKRSLELMKERNELDEKKIAVLYRIAGDLEELNVTIRNR